ncbi:hypothetical protein [Streptomyces sp. NPDC018321]|uniref:hypothetical protein n=1 Tax=unclassified Streptomyces TaxID=2593676 RepID=UPI0037B02C0A
MGERSEIWTVRNTMGMPHNFQVHDVQFRVLEVNGEAPPAVLRGPRTRSSCRSAWTSATGGHQH